jgi:hypothetical protein
MFTLSLHEVSEFHFNSFSVEDYRSFLLADDFHSLNDFNHLVGEGESVINAFYSYGIVFYTDIT